MQGLLPSSSTLKTAAWTLVILAVVARIPMVRGYVLGG